MDKMSRWRTINDRRRKSCEKQSDGILKALSGRRESMLRHWASSTVWLFSFLLSWISSLHRSSLFLPLASYSRVKGKIAKGRAFAKYNLCILNPHVFTSLFWNVSRKSNFFLVSENSKPSSSNSLTSCWFSTLDWFGFNKIKIKDELFKIIFYSF